MARIPAPQRRFTVLVPARWSDQLSQCRQRHGARPTVSPTCLSTYRCWGRGVVYVPSSVGVLDRRRSMVSRRLSVRLAGWLSRRRENNCDCPWYGVTYPHRSGGPSNSGSKETGFLFASPTHFHLVRRQLFAYWHAQNVVLCGLDHLPRLLLTKPVHQLFHLTRAHIIKVASDLGGFDTGRSAAGVKWSGLFALERRTSSRLISLRRRRRAKTTTQQHMQHTVCSDMRACAPVCL